MAGSFDDKGSGPGKPGQRPAPTIEGTATEVTVEAEAEKTASRDEPQAAAGETAPAPGPDDSGKTEPPEASSEGASPLRGARAASVLSLFAAGLLGGLAGAGALAAAWLYLPAEAPGLAPLEDRIAKLEGAPAAPDAALAKLDARLDALEARKPETPAELAALAERVNQMEASLKAMGEAAKDGGSVADAAAIGRQIDEAEARLDAKIDAALAEAKGADGTALEALKKEVADIDAKLKALAEAELSSGDAARLLPEIAVLDERLGKVESTLPSLVDAVDQDAADTKSATLAIAFANLRAAVEEGRPYATELATLAALSPGAGDLGGLLDYEDKGIPTLRALTASFDAARTAAVSASASEAGGSLLDRLLAGAESLVTIKRIDAAAEGDTPDAVLARGAAKLKDGDLAASVKEVETLQGPARAAFADWLDEAHARLDAEQTLRRLENILLVSLGGDAARDEGKTQEQQEQKD